MASALRESREISTFGLELLTCNPLPLKVVVGAFPSGPVVKTSPTAGGYRLVPWLES